MATSPDFNTSNQYIKYRIVVTENSTSIPNNTSSVNVKVQAWRTNTGYTTYGSGTCYCNINGTDYSQAISSSQTIGYNSYTELFNQDVTITHDADGKKTIYVSAYISHARFNSSSQGFNVVLSDIPRQATILTATNFNDTDNPTITYSNPAGNVVTSLQACISLDNSTAAVSYRDLSKTGSSYTFSLTQAERDYLLASTPNSNTLTVYFIVKTVIAGVTYYSSLSRTMSVVSASPIIHNYTYRDSSPATVNITGDNQKIIQKNSYLVVDIGSVTALKSATLSTLSIRINENIVNVSLSGDYASNLSVNIGFIDSSTNVVGYISLTDSRGNTTVVTLNITILEWSLPTGTVSLSRKNNYYDDTYITVVADYSSLNGQNVVGIKYQYKEAGAGSYSSFINIQDGVTDTITLDNTKAYDFRVVVSDLLGSTTIIKSLPTGIPIFFVDRLLRSVGIGTLPDETNMLAVDRRLQLKNVNHEKVLDLWSTSQNNGAIRSAQFRIYNQDGNTLIYMNADGTNGNGFIRVNKANGNNLIVLGRSSSDGGYINVANSSNNNVGTLYAGANGGYLDIRNNSGDRVALLWVGSNSDGVLSIYNSSGDNTLNLEGNSGRVTAREYLLKDSSGVTNGWIKTDQNGGQFVACNPSNKDVAWLYANNGGNLWLSDDSQNETVKILGSTGSITCVSVTQTSSIKVKKNIKPLNITEAVKILQLIAVTFDFKDEDKGVNKRGFIAEDVAEIIPEVVTPETDKEPASLDYISLIPYLQTVIKDQESRLQEQDKKIQELEKRLTELESKIR